MCDNIRNRFRPGEVFLLGLCYFSEAFAAALGGFWAALAWVATIVVWISHEAHEDVGPGGRTRTCNPPVKSRMLWPVELRQEKMCQASLPDQRHPQPVLTAFLILHATL